MRIDLQAFFIHWRWGQCEPILAARRTDQQCCWRIVTHFNQAGEGQAGDVKLIAQDLFQLVRESGAHLRPAQRPLTQRA